MSTYILYQTELYHHGIKGQKWGRRRFQNKDGSLTPEGKRRTIHEIAEGKMTDKQLKRQGYDAFNVGLVNHDENGQSIAKKFYSKLKSMGYDAVEDINDKKYSGYNAKSAVIVFNRKDKISVSDVKKMTEEQVAANAKKAYGVIIGTELLKTGAKAAALGTGLGLLGRASNAVSNNQAIRNYKLEHPNTQLTDAQIYEMLTKGGGS